MLDFFAGSGSFGEAAARNRRDFVLVDNNPDAVRIMADRLGRFGPDLISEPDKWLQDCGGSRSEAKQGLRSFLSATNG